MAANRSLKAYALIAIIMEIFFAIIYAFQLGFSKTVQFSDMNGIIVAVFLTMLLLVGFGLVSTYLKQFSISSMTLNFIMLTFTIQMYFLVRKFWQGISLGNPNTQINLKDNPYNIRLSLDYGATDYKNNLQYFTLAQAIACAISMFAIMFPLLGKVGPGQALIICIAGNFGYALNEVLFWRLSIQDNGYGMRIFLFGSTAGLVASFIIGKNNTANHQKYGSQYTYQTFGLIGCIFVWILLPWLSVIEQSQITAPFILDFRQIAPLNIFFALSASCCASFATSIWVRTKISVHDIVFSAFSGGIAYGASSNVFPNPFPALLIGFLVGILTTYANTLKKRLNQKGVIDSLGSCIVFLVPSLIGGLYSSILYTTSAYGPNNTDENVQVFSPGRSRFGQGGYQLIGIALSIGIGLAAGILIGIVSKTVIGQKEPGQLFNDSAYISQDFDALKKSKEVDITNK